MKVLVTGSLGYIGCVVVGNLLQGGHDVVGCDLDIFPLTSFWKPSSYESAMGANHIRKDIRKLSEEDLRGVDAVIHLAAVSNDPAGELDPKLTQEVNYDASVRLADLCKKAGVKTFVFSSSCSVYGGQGDKFLDEKSETAPLTAYAKSKIMTEERLREIADKNMQVIILRNATVFGASPRMRLDLVVNNMSGHAFAKGKVMVLSDGSAWRPNVHVEDVSKAFIDVIERSEKLERYDIFNIGEENQSVKQIANIIGKTFGKDVEFNPKGSRDARSYKVDFSKAKNVLNYSARFSVADGARELLDIFNKNGFDESEFKNVKYYTVDYWKQYLSMHKA